MPVATNAFQYEFVPYGTQAAPVSKGDDRLFLDVGNALAPGVIDTHQLAAHCGSVARMVVQHCDLVVQSLREGRLPADPFTIVLHHWPDLDCVASAYLAKEILTSGAPPAGAGPLIQYLDAVDQGAAGLSQENPYSLYAAYMLLLHDQALDTGRSRNEQWTASVQEGMQLLDFVLKQVERQRVSVLDVDAFACPGLFRPRDRAEVDNDLRRYRDSLANPAKQARILELELPTHFGGSKRVPALLIRDVQNPGDPNRCIFFKDWARTDRLSAPGKSGFAALSVFVSESSGQPRRAIISVTPNSTITLKELAVQLERTETTKRIEMHGYDDRLRDPTSGAARANRKGFDNPDPWYDGRGQNYTIIDAPRSGTVLTADEVETIFLQFARGDTSTAMVSLPSPQDECESDGVDEDAVRRLSLSLHSWRTAQAHQPPPIHTDIFISYARKNLAWAEAVVYQPLASQFGADKIFFDRKSLHGGMNWLDKIATAIANCRVFVPLYSTAFFASDFCQWELQLALLRDPTGRKRIVAPLVMEDVALPTYCGLIQGERLEASEGPERLFSVFADIMGRKGCPEL